MPKTAQTSNTVKATASKDTHQPAQRDAAPSAQRTGVGPGAFTSGDMLALQRTMGNRAVQRLLGSRPAPQRAAAQPTTGTTMLQRLPTRQAVVAQLGEPDNALKIGGIGIGGSSYYKPVLEALTNYQLYIAHTRANSATLIKLMALYDAIQTTVDKYIAHKDDNQTKLAYMQQLRIELVFERGQARAIAERLDQAGPQTQPQTWSDAFENKQLMLPSGRFHPTAIEDEHIIRTVGGGMNPVDVVQVGGEERFFKADKNEVPLYPLLQQKKSDGNHASLFQDNSRYATMNDETLYNEYIMPRNAGIIDTFSLPQRKNNPHFKEEVDQLVKETGFRKQYDLHYARRDVAMYRIDQLLGAGVIAPAQLALRKTGNGYVEGSLMKGAKGKTINELHDDGAIKSDDAGLQRLLSRLQLIDALAYQIDRHHGNFYLETDGRGHVINITGIDNDMSFGARAQDIDADMKEYPGISKFVDEELADRIIALHPQELANAVFGLLSEAEINALLTRLAKLQARLVSLKAQKQLLKPEQWGLTTAQELKQEKKSYYGGLPIKLPSVPTRPNAVPFRVTQQVRQRPQKRQQNGVDLDNDVPQIGNNVPQLEDVAPAPQNVALPALQPDQDTVPAPQNVALPRPGLIRRPRKVIDRDDVPQIR